ncbi:MAG: scyllo-inosose 3-dehydrogenase [Thermoproteota archaeon]
MLAAILNATWKPRKGFAVSKMEEEARRAKSGSRVWFNPSVRLSDVTAPSVGPKDLLVRVKACGICGSDLHMQETDAEGYMLYPGLTKLPVVIGHEFSGEVIQVGSGVSGFKAGDMVTAEEMWWCGECDPCRTGYPNQCLNLEEAGFTADGGFAELISVHQKYCWKINGLLSAYGSEDKAYEAGSLAEPTAVSYNALFIRAGGFKPGSNVVVYGAGPIGLSSIALAKASGAEKVVCFDVSDPRLQIASLVGADFAFNSEELAIKGIRPHEKVLEITGGAGADMQVEAAGAPDRTLPEMEKSLAIGGKIAVIGRADVLAPVYLESFQVRAGQIFGSQGHSGSGIFPNVIRLFASGKIDMTRIITRRYSLSEFGDAVKQASKRVDAKITVKP